MKNNQTKLIPKNNLSTYLGKIPPQAVELEDVVIGAILIDKSAIEKVASFLKPDHFYKEENKKIYRAAIELSNSNQPIDIRTIVESLRRSNLIESVGGSFYVAKLTSKVSSAANIEYHARIIVEYAVKRDIITLASKMMEEAYDDSVDFTDLLSRYQYEVDAIVGNTFKGQSVIPVNIIYRDSIKRLIKSRSDTGITGVKSGYHSMDRLTGGWQNSDLIILAGRPSMGKSAVAGNFCINAAINFDTPTAIFSLEMSSVQFVNRMMSVLSEVELTKIIRANYNDNELEIIGRTTSKLDKAPIYIDDTPGISIIELKAKCRRLKVERGVRLIIIDYLQLMTGDPDADNREQEIASITRGLKSIAKELDVPIIALSQLSRAVETRGGDKKPVLSDLRESGAVEADADLVIFVYRPEYYKISSYDDGSSTFGVVELIIAKHRNGALDSVKLKFISKFSKVKEINEPTESPFIKPIVNKVEMRDYTDSKAIKENDDLPF